MEIGHDGDRYDRACLAKRGLARQAVAPQRIWQRSDMRAVVAKEARRMSARARKRAEASKKSVARTNATGNSRKDLVLEHLLDAAAELFLERG